LEEHFIKGESMKRFMAHIKEDFLNLIGAISIEELVSNLEVQDVIEDIHKDLSDISIVSKKFH
jgi:hypothetical protein